MSFNGTANINLPGVNTTGNQNTTGNAATATKLQTARTIGGVSFDGSANIDLPGVNKAGSQNTTGNAATATKLQTARAISGVSFNGSANIEIIPVGVPLPWPSATPPTGWLKCNGAAFDMAKYPLLAKVYTTGKLPDLRGEFIRGWDDGRGVDSGRALLSSQDATLIRTALQDYYGVDVAPSVKVGIAFASADKVQTSGIPADSKAGDNSNYVPASADNSITGTQRTAEDNFYSVWISMRPRNTSFNYIVRAA
ncbi:tail fiber protein [Escherichia whittamii]|uniref:tail fiber protein n=1 Tax=Escherichia whittamii TaxID=2762229 RepID=UPI002DBB2CF6|nr:tail fiber protein [Escherichia whittamii]MEB7939104.1 phage tail protein [Escherichia whittamii]